MVDERSMQRELRSLEGRIYTLESIVLRTWCLAVAALLVGGVLLPYMYEENVGDDDVGWSVLTTPFASAAETGEGSDAGLEVVFVIGFVGLLAVVLALVVGLFVIGGRHATDRAAKVLRVLLVLAGIGTAVVLLLTVAGIGSEDNSAGPGGLVLLAGVLGYATLLTRGGRELWEWKPQPLPAPKASTTSPQH